MTDILFSKSAGVWDLALTADKDIQLTPTRPVEVGQRVLFELSMWYGESPFDTTKGIPYLDLIFPSTGPVDGAVAYIVQRAVEVEGVDSLSEPPTYTLENRTLTLTIPIQVGGADDVVTVTPTATP